MRHAYNKFENILESCLSEQYCFRDYIANLSIFLLYLNEILNFAVFLIIDFGINCISIRYFLKL